MTPSAAKAIPSHAIKPARLKACPDELIHEFVGHDIRDLLRNSRRLSFRGVPIALRDRGDEESLQELGSRNAEILHFVRQSADFAQDDIGGRFFNELPGFYVTRRGFKAVETAYSISSKAVRISSACGESGSSFKARFKCAFALVLFPAFW